jgi:hypothetical protein
VLPLLKGVVSMAQDIMVVNAIYPYGNARNASRGEKSDRKSEAKLQTG